MGELASAPLGLSGSTYLAAVPTQGEHIVYLAVASKANTHAYDVVRVCISTGEKEVMLWEN